MPEDWPALHQLANGSKFRPTQAAVGEMFLNAVPFRRRQATVEKCGDILSREMWVVSGHESLRVQCCGIYMMKRLRCRSLP